MNETGPAHGRSEPRSRRGRAWARACPLLLALSLQAAAADRVDAADKGFVILPNILRVGAFGPPCTHATLEAAIAATSSISPNIIRLANNQLYSGVNVGWTGRNVEIVGGYADCAAENPGPVPTILSGGNDADDSVIEIFGGSSTRRTARLRNLVIEGGEEDPDGGGGVQATDNVELVLEDVRITGNASYLGGGIALDGSNRPVNLVIEGEVEVSSNAGGLGGGLHCNEAEIRVRGQLTMASNVSTASGGAIHLTGCMLSSGPADPVHGVLEVRANTAPTGGGIRATMASRIDVLGARILDNTATTLEPRGGGLFLDGAGTRARLPRLNLSGNRSEAVQFGGPARGGGAYLSEGAVLEIDGGPQPCPSLVFEAWDSRACALVAYNVAGTGAAIFAAVDAPSVQLRQTRIARNEGDVDVVSLFDGASAVFDGVLLDDNLGDADFGAAVRAAEGVVIVAHTTASGNVVGRDFVSSGAGTQVLLYNSVLLGPGTSVAANDGGAVAGSCLFADDAALPTATQVDPSAFVDVAAGDLEPVAGSPVIDRCAAAPIDPFVADILGRPRPFDVAAVANLAGTYDAGAYESRGSPDLFGDGFEP
jgi:hypothetical protein